MGDGVVGVALLLGRPLLDVLQYVDSRGALGLDPPVLVVAEHRPVHGGEIDDGDGEGAVHVENDTPQPRFGGGRVIRRHVN